jgi:alanine racemase
MLHQTHARIHLKHIKRNIENLRRHLGRETRLLLAMKANGYGHDAVAVASMAEHYGLVDMLGVATVPEGLELRREGIRLPILKFSPAFPEEMEAALEGGLTLAVCDRANIRQLHALCRQRRIRASVHLKVDTGMRRLGVEPREAPELAAFIEQECPSLHLEGMFTHLPVGDQHPGNGYTKDQIARFKACTEAVSQALRQPPALRHCASSGAILEHPESWLDMVRTGTLAYGYYPMGYPTNPLDLLPGLSLVTRISHLKRIQAGTGVGYGLTWKAPQDVWIATIPMGYADGLDRRLSNRGRALVRGRSHELVGMVCMDQAMLCLGTETDAQVGDEVVLIGRSGGEEITLCELAQRLGTIPCEITCQIGPRVRRLIDTI